MTGLSYPFTVQPLSKDEGGGYLIEFPDLPGCISDGEMLEATVSNGVDALECWIAAMREAGRPVPPPSKSVVGSRTVGVDRSVYRSLVDVADQQGLDLETIVNLALLRGLIMMKNIRTAAKEEDEVSTSRDI